MENDASRRRESLHSKITVFNMTIPAYGTMVILGAMVVTVLGIIVCLCRKMSIDSFLKLEFFGGIFAILGAKLWFMLVNAKDYTGKSFTLENFSDSGFSSYGGIILGMIAVWITAMLIKVDFESYARNLLFLVPLFHAFWKTGCYMGGCCYGIEYSGLGAVVFPEGVKAPAGISLFPIQILEVIILLVLSVFFLVKSITGLNRPVIKYLVVYATSRLITDFLRQRPDGGLLSVAQLVSIGSILIVGVTKFIENKYRKRRILE